MSELADANRAEIVPAAAQANRQLTIKSLLGGSKMAEIQKVAGTAMSAEKLIKLFAIAASRTPKLMQCTPVSFLDAMVRCAELGLVPSTLGTVYLIPFENRAARTVECQMIIGYRGLIELARRSGQISTIQAEVVRKGDEFDFEWGIEPKFRHKPLAENMDDEQVTHAWAMARFRDGSHQLIVMTRAEVEKVRKGSKAGKFGPWNDHFAEMAKKTAVRRLCKYLPLTPDVEVAIADVDRAEVAFDMPELAGAGNDNGDPNETLAAAQAAATSKGAATNAQAPTSAAEEPKMSTPDEAANFLKDLD